MLTHYCLQRALIRQNSERIGTFAEEVVLPKTRRSVNRMNSIAHAQFNAVDELVDIHARINRSESVAKGQCNTPEVVHLEDDVFEAINIKAIKTDAIPDEIAPQEIHFPVFMISLSVIQVRTFLV